MKRKDREPYLVLVNLVDRGLCNCCKFADWDGWCASEVNLICEHPLPVINGEYDGNEHPIDTWTGGDCWAFRPKETVQDVAIWVGILLEGNMPHWSSTYKERIAIIPSEKDKEYGLVL